MYVSMHSSDGGAFGRCYETFRRWSLVGGSESQEKMGRAFVFYSLPLKPLSFLVDQDVRKAAVTGSSYYGASQTQAS